MARQLSRGGATIQDDYLIASNHGGGCPADCDLGARGQLLASCEIHDGRRSRQSAPVYALEEPFVGQFAEIAADGVFGQAELVTDVFGDNLAVLFKFFED